MLRPTKATDSTHRVMRGVGIPPVALVAAALLSLLLISTAHADRTDVVILRNGDHITGEIRNLSQGRVEYKTDDMSTIYVEWERIHHITSVNRFEIIDDQGITRFGSIGRTDTPGEMVVITPTASDTLDLGSIVRITWIKAGFIARLRGDISVGASYTRATKTTEATLSGKTNYRGEKFRGNLSYTAYITEQADRQTSRYDVGFSIGRFLRRRWTVGGALQAEHNEELGLERRVSLRATGSRVAVETSNTILDFSLGLSTTREEYVGRDSTSYNLELPVTLQYTRFTFNNPESDIRFSGSFYPSLTTRGRYRASLGLDFDYEVLNDFYIVLRAYYDYDSDPPSGAARDDHRFNTSLKWSFG